MTPANSSSISDGGAALVMMRRSEADKRGLKPRATILGHASHAQAPGLFTTAPIGAMNKLLDRLGWTSADADLFEVNEAFAVVTMAAMRELDIPHDKSQRARRRLRAGAPGRCFGRAHHADAAQRAGEVRAEARHGQPLHRRR